MSLKKIIVGLASLLFGFGLIYYGIEVILGSERLELLVSKPVSFHLTSCLLVLPIYLLGGLENFMMFRIIYKKHISLYDVLTLPFVIHLWGYLIPLQGSYLYNSAYYKTKYKIAITNTTSIYLVSFSITFVLAGLAGLAYNYFVYYNVYLVLIAILASLNPLVILGFHKVFGKMNFSKTSFVNKLFIWVRTIISDYISGFKYLKLIGFLIVTNLSIAVIFALWSVWIASNFDLDLSFTQLLLLALLMKVTLLFKLTPGNLGINQFTAAGIITLLGASPADGFTLSLYQSAIFILTATVFGSIFSVVNMKSFSFKKIIN